MSDDSGDVSKGPLSKAEARALDIELTQLRDAYLAEHDGKDWGFQADLLRRLRSTGVDLRQQEVQRAFGEGARGRKLLEAVAKLREMGPAELVDYHRPIDDRYPNRERMLRLPIRRLLPADVIAELKERRCKGDVDDSVEVWLAAAVALLAGEAEGEPAPDAAIERARPKIPKGPGRKKR